MGHIYKITNRNTQKVYIGQTTYKYVSTRWCAHKDRINSTINNKLYKSMRKHGIEAFYIETVEANIDNSLLDEREIYWIAFYNSYKKGYNSDLGGNRRETKIIGKEDEIIDLYKTKGIGEIASIYSVSRLLIRKFLKSIGVYKPETRANKYSFINKCVQPTPILQFTKNNEFIKEYPSMISAIKELQLNKKASSQISRCCQGKKPSAYGYIWKYKQ